MTKKLKITQIRGLINKIPNHVKTIEALGLKHREHSVILNDTPQIRGMIKKVSFMVKVEEINS